MHLKIKVSFVALSAFLSITFVGAASACPYGMEWHVQITDMGKSPPQDFRLPKDFVSPSARIMCQFPKAQFVKGRDGGLVSSVMAHCTLESGDTVLYPTYADAHTIGENRISIIEKGNNGAFDFKVYCAQITP